MSRRAKPGPPMVIERVSDGREVRPRVFVDDFTGEELPMVQDTRPARSVANGWEVREREQREREAKARALLAQVMPEAGPKPIAKIGGLGLFKVGTPWRRV